MIKSRLAELKKRYGVGGSAKNEDSTHSGSKGGFNTSTTSEPQQFLQQSYLDSLQENLAKKLQNIKQRSNEEEEEEYGNLNGKTYNNISRTPQKPENMNSQKDVVSMTDYKSRLRQEMLAKKKQAEEEYVETEGGKRVKSALADRVSNLERTLQGSSGRNPQVSNFNSNEYLGESLSSNFIEDRPSQNNINKKKQTRRNEDF